MPFKLKLKKSRHYSVVSKSLFVISVELLDNTNIECTLSSESTGQDCLDIVCQKLCLNQPKFFGLQYTSKIKDCNCWLELDRPIKRQLDKYAREFCVYLRVMYYVISGVCLLNDEVTRYHYFLQLKSDVIEERISCTPVQAVELASYCMQAEFGNFNAERHTAHYLKDFQLFPKSFTGPEFLENLTDAASRQHAALHNIPQGTAEEYYICACQILEGYGQEIFHVKDKNGDDPVLGVSLTGIHVNYKNKDGRIYSWVDINNVINHKREFTIEPIVTSDKVDFHFSDVDSAKNAWRFCVLQHMFYRQNEMNYNAAAATALPLTDMMEKNSSNFQQNFHHQQERLRQVESYEDITSSWDKPTTTLASQSLAQRAQSTSALDLNTPTDIDKLRSMLPSYRPAPDYETAVQQKYRNSAGAAVPTREPIRSTHHHTMLYSSQPEIHQNDAAAAAAAYTTHMYPDVTHNNIEQKATLFNSGGGGGGYAQTAAAAQIDNHSNMAGIIENMRLLHLYKPPPPYPSNRISSNSTPDLAGISQQTKPQMNFFNNLVSGSSPDLVSTGNFLNQQYLKHYGQVLYANHPAHSSVHRSHSYLPPQHGTYENLSSIFNNNNMLGRPPHAVIMDNPNITKHIKKVYDEQGNIIYCMPANMKQILQENQLPSTGFVVTRNQNAIVAHSPELSNSNEPIYENIPLPWQNSNEQIRARTQSMHSAPEVTQMMNQSAAAAAVPPNNVLPNMQLQLNSPMSQSKENLYANVDRNRSVHSSNTDLSSKQNISCGGSGGKLNDSSNIVIGLNSKVGGEDSPNTMSRTSTFVINNSKISTATTSSPSVGSYNDSNLNNDTTYSEDITCCSSSSAAAAANSTTATATTVKKKKKWGILMGRSKSSEKVKSATLGREKEKSKDKSQNNNRHRWSTGLPRSHPLPPSISKEAMCQLLEYKLSDNQLFFEFDKIPKKKQNADFLSALFPENVLFNRFKDTLPYEDNRIRLTPTKDNKYGYINASHITVTVGSKQRFYVAAQGPTLVTLPYFWQCVWEAEVYLLVQLTDPIDDIDYLPDATERCVNIGQEFQVWWEFSQETGHCITSKIRLCHVLSRRYRTLWHLHYTDWGDQGCPHSVAHFLGFLEELQSVQQHSMSEIPQGHNKNPPVLVHCTAGVGRTGLAILSDLLLYTVDHNQEVDIPRVVEILRHQRAYMVQTVAQYRFVYSLLIHYLKQTRLI